MKLFFGVVSLMLAAGCGAVDNVSACEKWKASATCGSTNYAAAVSCDLYANTTCDISDYFDCLSTNTKCTNGTADVTGWSACASKATCQ